MIPTIAFVIIEFSRLSEWNRLVGATRTTADLPLLLTSRSVSWPSCCATSIVGVLQAPKTSKRFGLFRIL